MVTNVFGSAVAVTPSDTVPIGLTLGLWVGGTGALSVIMQSGQTVTFTAVPVGLLPLRVSQVKATGTTATNIVALW